MSHCYLEQAGLYRATLEAMMFGAPTQKVEDQRFNDSVLERKEIKVNDLVEKFEKNMKKSGVAPTEFEAESEIEPEIQPRSRIPSMEEFIEGILRASSPIPEAPPLVELQETPILPYRPVKRELNFAILDAVSADMTKSFKPTLKSEASTTPKSKATKESPDSAYFSAGSSAASTPTGSSQPAQAHGEQLDIYLKLARAQLHKQIKKYSTWDAQKLRSIATKVSSMRLSALQKSSLDCPTTQMMFKIYENCLTGPVTKELDTIVVSIFDLLDEQVHVEKISVLEEYVVMKYCKKTMQ